MSEKKVSSVPPSVAAKAVSIDPKRVPKTTPVRSRTNTKRSHSTSLDRIFADANNQPIPIKLEITGYQNEPEVIAAYGTKCLLKVEQVFHILVDAKEQRITRWFVENERIAYVSEEQSYVIFAKAGGRLHTVFDLPTESYLGSLDLYDKEIIVGVNSSAVLTVVHSPSGPDHFLFRLNKDISQLSSRDAISLPGLVGSIQLAREGLAFLATVPFTPPTSKTNEDKNNKKKNEALSFTGSTTRRVIYWLDDQGRQRMVIPPSVNTAQLLRPDLIVFHSKRTGVSALHRIDYDRHEFPLIKTLCKNGSQPVVDLDFAVYVQDATQGQLTVFNLLDGQQDAMKIIDKIDSGPVDPFGQVHPSPSIDSNEGFALLPSIAENAQGSGEPTVPLTVVYAGFSQLRFATAHVHQLAALPPKVVLTETA